MLLGDSQTTAAADVIWIGPRRATTHYSRQRATSRFLRQVFDGAIDQVVVSMLSATDPSPEELRQLERIIAEARRLKQRRQKEEP